MMRIGTRVPTALCAFAICVVAAVTASAEGGRCGNGVVNQEEECDPGGQLYCDGNPNLGTCRTGADCASGTNCYFGLTCCKFNCQYVGQGATCYDGDDCTEPDRCNNVGECVGQPASGMPCNDGNTCTGNDVCVAGECTGSLPPECDDHNPCTDDYCDAETGCGHEYNTAPCDDGQLCTGNDRCDAGSCSGTPAIPASCNDGNVCTDDGCDPAANDGRGACTQTGNTLPCNDGQFCTQADVCSGGVCRGTPFIPPSCTDDNPCTDNACDPSAAGGAGACGTVNNTAPCDDGLFCTVNDRCNGGSCSSGVPYTCNDGNVCTTDRCDESTDACVHQGDSSKAGQSCDDASMCTTGDRCDSSGSCAGTPIVCDDGDDVCTADTCNPASGCTFNVVVESRTCASCADGVDNEGDGDTDGEDCDCNLLCESFNYAVVASRESTRRTAYFGKDTRAARAIDPDLGSYSRSAPYPVGPSASNACSQGILELVERATIDGVGAASTSSEFGDGDEMRLGFFVGYVPPGDMQTTGIPPFVGPRAICSATPVACSQDSDCPSGETCRPAMTIVEPGNEYVDLTGTHAEFTECEEAKASLPRDFAMLSSLPPTQELGNVRYKEGDPPIIVTGPGIHVVRLVSLRVDNGTTLQIIGDESTAAVVLQVERSFTIGVRSRVELAGGLKPDQVIWVVDRRGRAYVGNQEVEPSDDDAATLPGTLLAPEKNIVVGKKARVAGALLGRQVQLNEKAVVSHRPYMAAPVP